MKRFETSFDGFLVLYKSKLIVNSNLVNFILYEPKLILAGGTWTTTLISHGGSFILRELLTQRITCPVEHVAVTPHHTSETYVMDQDTLSNQNETKPKHISYVVIKPGTNDYFHNRLIGRFFFLTINQIRTFLPLQSSFKLFSVYSNQ